MRWSYVEEHWTAMMPQILARWSDMEEDELEGIDGDREAFLDYLCEVEGIEPDEAEEELAEFLEGAEAEEDLDFDEGDEE